MQMVAELARQAQAPTPRIYPLYQSGTTIRLPSGSIKGDVKKKTLFLFCEDGIFF
jgi:hypothetical protein